MTGPGLAIEGRLLPLDEGRGTRGMVLFILTEALLFAVLFFAYFYLGQDQTRWPPQPPRLGKALVMLGVLLSSSGVLLTGEAALRGGSVRRARMAAVATLLLGAVFLAIQWSEYAERLKTLRPGDSAYGSIFYTLTSLHAAHVALGMLMLGFVAALPVRAFTTGPPHRPLRAVSLYWHFVDGVWVAIVALLYVEPRW
jgi:heme/copper-type cytochrome/quinol oxidase subunit 3